MGTFLPLNGDIWTLNGDISACIPKPGKGFSDVNGSKRVY